MTTSEKASSAAVGHPSTRPGDGFMQSLLLLWFLHFGLYVYLNWKTVAAGLPAAPDDLMRMVQVRDLLAGQGWFDISQHRMNPPYTAPMHWSRLVDVPLALIIIALRPFLDNAAAEFAALLIVPAVAFLAALAAAGLLARRLVGQRGAVLAMILMGGILDVVQQFRPMRIDHHGWQMVLGVAAVLALIGDRPIRAGALAGGAMALWMHVSIEGLPYAVLLSAALALRLLIWSEDHEKSRREAARMTSFLWSLSVSSIVLFVATQSYAGWMVRYCDAINIGHVASFAAAALLITPLLHSHVARPVGRLLVLIVCALGTAAVFTFSAPHCVGSPFASLDPLVREFWHLRVLEGMPLWKTADPLDVPRLAVMILGAIGVGLGLVSASSREERVDWLTLAIILAGSIIMALLVSRASGIAALYALPGLTLLTLVVLKRVRSIRAPAQRIGATLVALTFLVPYLVLFLSIIATFLIRPVSADEDLSVVTYEDIAASVAGLPPMKILAPLDFAPSLLLLTPHTVLASGHHRNADAMLDVLTAFVGTPSEAEAVVRSRGIDMVAVVPKGVEFELFARTSPEGFAARVGRGDAPEWLTPVHVDGAVTEDGTPIFWRVKGTSAGVLPPHE